MLSHLVGQGAEKVRGLFADAYADWNAYGSCSPLHVILIDEIDSMCPQRGLHSSVDGGSTDQIVGTFLTMIDGIRTANNFIIIGTTNKIDTIDSALLRPGRLSYRFHIGLPDKTGRKQIWEIHLKNLFVAKIADRSILDELTEKSEGFTGAMI